eukprot:CAMPEP_0184328690 /NCGR_PEP_ID=MMETSP1049-20130417/143755_1 /TAXON_ID=77928 /ORGANISM="Proteomonas sulcata, Strain CCMP704" /LENGTH=397 /DNA_ID=CAMNT_0026651015 /DNA_START=422 /DNA_END=1615 /DNA_ORIENTATION=+
MTWGAGLGGAQLVQQAGIAHPHGHVALGAHNLLELKQQAISQPASSPGPQIAVPGGSVVPGAFLAPRFQQTPQGVLGSSGQLQVAGMQGNQQLQQLSQLLASAHVPANLAQGIPASSAAQRPAMMGLQGDELARTVLRSGVGLQLLSGAGLQLANGTMSPDSQQRVSRSPDSEYLSGRETRDGSQTSDESSDKFKEGKKNKSWKIMLTAEQAVQIYSQRPQGGGANKGTGFSASVGRKFGVSAKTIRDIWNRETWVKATREHWTVEENDQYKEANKEQGSDDPNNRPAPGSVASLLDEDNSQESHKRARGRPKGVKDSRPRKRRATQDSARTLPLPPPPDTARMPQQGLETGAALLVPVGGGAAGLYGLAQSLGASQLVQLNGLASGGGIQRLVLRA